jgi:hypothetical protein
LESAAEGHAVDGRDHGDGLLAQDHDGVLGVVGSAFGALGGDEARPAPALVFLDADHSYAAVRDEIAWAKSLSVPVIAGHDYGNPRFGVTRAVNEAFPEGVAVHGTVWAWGARR